MKKSSLGPLSAFAFFLSLNLHAESPLLPEFTRLFKSGQYSKAILVLDKTNPRDFVTGQQSYLRGLSFSKLQEYDNAIKNFEKAIKENNESIDLQYEYGQALYAANELKAARKVFKESVDKKFNTPASLYYIAHISQLLEEYPEAKEYYTELIKNKESDLKIKQISQFQLTETVLLMIREKIKVKEELEKNVDKYIVPMMKRAYEMDKSTQVAGEIDQRLHEILIEFNLDPDLLSNGRRVSSKRYSGYISQKIKFDDNISLTHEENNTQQSKKESYIFESEVDAKYDYIYKKKFIISPEIRLNFVQHSDQDTSDVYQNDSFSFNANLKNKYEHIAKTQPASFLFDIEFSKILKDLNLVHKREAYARSLNFGIGESISYFKFGDTTFKLKRKFYTGESTSINNRTTALSFDQIVALPNQHLLIGLLEIDYIDNYNNTSSNTNTYLARIDYLIPEIMPKYTLGLAIATTITKTLEQDATRGTEVSLNPSVDLSKEINEKMKISINYDFTKTNSKSTSYDYSKNIFTTDFRYSF